MRVRVPYKVLNCESFDIKMLSRFIVLKRMYVNSRIYNYSASNVASNLKKRGFSVSRTTIDRWIFSMKNCGWIVEKENGDLFFQSLEAIYGKRAKTGASIEFSSAKDLENKMYLELLKAKSRQCSFASGLNSMLGRNVSFKQEKVSKTLLKKLKHGPTNYTHFKISIDGLAKLFRVSKSSASRLVKQLPGVSIVKNITRLGKGGQNGLKSLNIQGTWSFRGYLYKREMNTYFISSLA